MRANDPDGFNNYLKWVISRTQSGLNTGNLCYINEIRPTS